LSNLIWQLLASAVFVLGIPVSVTALTIDSVSPRNFGS